MNATETDYERGYREGHNKAIEKVCCIHNTLSNYHCPICWESMKSLGLEPDNKIIIKKTDLSEKK